MEMLMMQGISKTFPGTVALDRVDFTLNEGEILSLLGENGAGKTTLMKILYGMVQPDCGQIFFKNKRLNVKKPLDAINAGICMVHQHFMLVPAFTVTENIVVGAEPLNGVFVDEKKADKTVRELIGRFRFNIDPDVKVEKLSVGEQQKVEILKTLYRKADVLILDEPTAVLTPHEVDELFNILAELRKHGTSIVIITHKLKETMSFADRICVLRDGRLIKSNVIPKETSLLELSEMMVGRKVELGVSRPAKNIGGVALDVKNLTVRENGRELVNDVSFQIRYGEILGVAGIEGNGQTQLLEALTGLRQPESMALSLHGDKISGDANSFLRTGIAHVPEDRQTMGLVGEMSIKNNVILGYHREADICSKGLLKSEPVKTFADECLADYQIKAPTSETPVKALSGGNQQKVVIARAFSHDPKALIVAHPTRGVDVGAMEYIHNRLLDLRDEGQAVLLVSADLDEVRALSDRIVVMYEGRLVAESKPGQHTEVELGMLMTGNVITKKEEANG